MTALDVLVHVKASKDWTESIDVGLRLAQQRGARAHGLLTLGDLARLKSLFAGNDKLIAERQSEWDQKATTSEARFHQALETHGVEGTWLVGEGHASELLSLLGRVHDLIVVEQNALGDEIDWDPAEETALGGGVPALIVPNKGAFTSVGQCIAIAWNQSREAALAVRGALPPLSGQSAWSSSMANAGKRLRASRDCRHMVLAHTSGGRALLSKRLHSVPPTTRRVTQF